MLFAGRSRERFLRPGEASRLRKGQLRREGGCIPRILEGGGVYARDAERLDPFLEALCAKVKQLPGVHGIGAVTNNEDESVVADAERQPHCGEARIVLPDGVIVGEGDWQIDKDRFSGRDIEVECGGAIACRSGRQRGRRQDETMVIAAVVRKLPEDLSRILDVLRKGASRS